MYLAQDITPLVMYCVNGKPRLSLLKESTDSMITCICDSIIMRDMHARMHTQSGMSMLLVDVK